MTSGTNLRPVITSLWLRLTAIATLGLVFYEGVTLAQGKAQGWTYYLSFPEVGLEIGVHLVCAALVGTAVGAVGTLIAAPVLWYFKSSRTLLANLATKIAVVLVVFLMFRLALEIVLRTVNLWSIHQSVLAAYYLAFAVALSVPRWRNEVLPNLENLVSDTMTRRTALAAIGGTAAVVFTEFALSRTIPVVKASLAVRRPKSNFLLVTFDALSAEDMSLYGRGLPTTPNIDAFARNATVFNKFFSASSFTTPCIATIMTGMYPSESHVYQLQGRPRPQDSEKSLTHLMRAAGYATGGFFSNPYAYYYVKGYENDFAVLPEPIFQQGGLRRLWTSTYPQHRNVAIGSQIEEYRDLEHAWNTLIRMPTNQSIRFRPEATFEQARQILDRLPEGFFLWVHVMAPHNPYLPGPEDHGRFLPDYQRLTYEEEYTGRWSPHYPLNEQNLVNQRRLRYDEYVATADRAFGAFFSELEKSGRLRDTTLIVSADHGESFEGGAYQHASPDLVRADVHIPLIIRTPGQQDGRRVEFTADQTALPPTILELAGQPKASWMTSESLVKWLNGQADDKGLAYTQYLETNSVSQPVRHGSIGVTDGQFEYVYYLDSARGRLRPMNDVQIWNEDRSAEYPAKAEALRAAIEKRFPDLMTDIQLPSSSAG